VAAVRRRVREALTNDAGYRVLDGLVPVALPVNAGKYPDACQLR
jgi:hypothetical protein